MRAYNDSSVHYTTCPCCTNVCLTRNGKPRASAGDKIVRRNAKRRARAEGKRFIADNREE